MIFDDHAATPPKRNRLSTTISVHQLEILVPARSKIAGHGDLPWEALQRHAIMLDRGV